MGNRFSFTGTIAVTSLLTAAVATAAAPQYVASVIEIADDLADQQYGDVNGDGLQDLLLTVWSEARGRELLVYHQGDNGSFPGQASQRIEIKKDIAAWALGDIRPEPGQELVFLTANSAYSYSTRKEGYAGNLEKLFDWDFLISVPEAKSLNFLGRLQDYDANGRPDLLLPGRKQYGLALLNKDGGFDLAARLPSPYDNPRLQESNQIGFDVSFEEGLSLNVEQASAFAGMFPERNEHEGVKGGWDRYGQGESILEAERWIAVVQPTRLDGDEHLDFAYIDDWPEGEGSESETGAGEATRRFNIVYGRGEGIAKQQADWQKPLKNASWVQFHDFNGDDRNDVITMTGRGENQGILAFFANRNGRFDFEKPDQVMRFSGYEVQAQVQDLNGDQRPELIVSYYSIGAMDALRKGSMLRSTLIYPAQSGGDRSPFASRPATKIEDSFSAESVKGLSERLDFSVDLDGDGRKDLVALDAAGALIGKSIDSDLRVSGEPIWRFVPLHLVGAVEPATLNKDARSDFILRHQSALTVLVSRP